MKKVFVLMILILAFGVTSMFGLVMESLSFHGEGGALDTIISEDETVTLDFSYSTTVALVPISVYAIIITYGDDDQVYSVASSYTDFSGPEGTNVEKTITFVMPAIPTTEETFAIDFWIKDSRTFPAPRNADLVTSSATNADYVDPETLPVELSAFDAVATAEDFVNINWTVQSETNISGYFIMRGLENDSETALMIPAFINATNGAQEHSYTFTDREVTPNNLYFYWLQSVEFSLQTELFGPTMVKVGEPTGGESVPVAFGTQLIGNYPNPFNPSTSVSFSVANPGHVTIDIYNIRGQLVKNLYNNNVSANKVNQRIDVLWNGRDNNNKEIASGVYYTKMIAGNETDFKKMLLMK